MNKLTTIKGIAAPLIRSNIDTDAIIPSREMKSVSKHGLSDGLFAAWRYLDEATRSVNTEFVLNRPIFRQANILLSGSNFGCGSSREHAVWALKEFGIECIIAESYGAIFYRNCIANGLLPITLSATEINRLVNGSVAELTINLKEQTIECSDIRIDFNITQGEKHVLLNGIDPIMATLAHQLLIDEFKTNDQARRPWMYENNTDETLN